MLTLEAQIPKAALEALKGFCVMLFQSVPEPVSVACASIPVLDVLPIRVVLEAQDYFYVDNMAPPYSSCRVLSPGLFSDPLVCGRKYAFNGTGFVDVGPVPPEFCFALRNDHSVALASGAAKRVFARGEETMAPLSLRRLHPGSTTYFVPASTYRLGVASLPGSAHGPGLLLATAILTTPKKQSVPCAPTLGRLVDVRFGESAHQVARYDVERSIFDVRPALD